MKLSTEQTNNIIRTLASQAIKKELDQNSERVSLVAEINRLKSLGIDVTVLASQWADLPSKNRNTTYASKHNLGLAKKCYENTARLNKLGTKLKKVNINTPKMRETLLAMGLTDKQASLIIHKACDIKSHHDKSIKAAKYKKKVRIIGRNEDKSVKLKTKRISNEVFNEDYTQDQAESNAKAAIEKRTECRKAIKEGKIPSSELLKMDLWHGTHYDKMSSDFGSTVTGKQKSFNKSTPPASFPKINQLAV